MEQKNLNKIILILSGVTVIIHLFAVIWGQYGIFRDELYYIACANHPEFGYVDQPPLSIWILSGWITIFGDTLFSIRFLPAIFSGAATFLIGTLAKEFGGQKYAVILACFASMLAPIFLGFFSVYNMNFWEIVLWPIVFLIMMRIVISTKSKYWIWIGLLIGFGALNKISMLWLGAGIFIGIILTSDRTMLRSWAPWLAGLLALIIFSPFIFWNITHDFAHLEFIRNAATEKYASQNPITFFSGLLLLMNPMAAPIWLAGFWFLLSNKEHRIIGFSVVFVLVLLLINIHSKAEYFTSAMTALLPAGAVQLEKIFQGRFRSWIRIPYLSLVILMGILLIPMTLDVLPVPTFTRYMSATGLSAPSTEGKKLESLPQFFADRFGWRNMAVSAAKVYKTLSESEKRNTLIFCRNYGEAGAIEYFGRESDLPPVISPHNSYWYWSLKYLNQNATFIFIGVKNDKLNEIFEETTEAGTIYTEHAMPYENNLPIIICRKAKTSIFELWKKKKMFI